MICNWLKGGIKCKDITPPQVAHWYREEGEGVSMGCVFNSCFESNFGE